MVRGDIKNRFGIVKYNYCQIKDPDENVEEGNVESGEWEPLRRCEWNTQMC